VTAISYHNTVNDLHGLAFAGKGPFARTEWFALLEQHGAMPTLTVARAGNAAVCLSLVQCPGGLEVLSNWYAFTWAPLATPNAPAHLWTALAEALRGKGRLTFSKLCADDADALQPAFSLAGWTVIREVCDSNHHLPVAGRSFAQYLAARPGPLRTTLKRKAKHVELRLSRQFSADDWAAYEDIYQHSWKPDEGAPALLRQFAQQESAAGHYLFGMATANGKPVAAQFWTVEQGTAYIHKLAHLPDAQPLSPGTTLTAAMLEEVIDRDHVEHVDFGTGNDAYKADWMDAVRPRYRLTCLRPGNPAHWPQLIKAGIGKLVSRPAAG
jgi:Acetyltransferase (GNAT) domain